MADGLAVTRATRKDIAIIAGACKKPTRKFRLLNLDSNIISDVEWSADALARQRDKGRIAVVKDRGLLVGWGMPITCDVEMAAQDKRYLVAGFAHESGGAEKFYRDMDETANIALSAVGGHGTRDVRKLLLIEVAKIAENLPGIRRLSGTLPRHLEGVAKSLGMRVEKKKKGPVYATLTFEGKKIGKRKIEIFPSEPAAPGRKYCPAPENLGSPSELELVHL